MTKIDGNKKGPIAANDRAQMTNGKDDSTPSLPESLHVEPPKGCRWINRRTAEMILEDFNLAMEGFDDPTVKIRMELDPAAFAKGWTPFVMSLGSRCFFGCICGGYRPKYQADAQTLLMRVEDAYQTIVPVEDAHSCLKNLKAERTLLTDARAYAMELLKDASQRLDEIGIPLMDDIRNPRNWTNPIPEGTQIEGLWFDRSAR